MRFCVSWLFFLVAGFISSCDTFISNPIQNIRSAEYSRQVDFNDFSHWLNSRNPQLRQMAVEALGRIQDTTTAGLIASALNDTQPEVRSAAAFSLGQLFDPVAEKYIIEGLNKESSSAIRAKLVEGFGKSATNQHPEQLQTILNGNDPDLQKTAAIACGILAYRGFAPHSWTAVLGEMAKNSPDPELAWRAAYALYRIGALRSLNDFIAGLDRPEPLVKFFSLKGLERVAALIKSPDFQTHRNQPGVSDLLKTYQSPDFHRKLLEQLQDSTWYVRVAALAVLGRMGMEEFQRDIVASLDDRHPYVQLQAIRALDNFLNWYSRREMRRLYAEAQDWRIKGEALALLARIEPQEAFQHVQTDLADLPWPQNYYAIKTLENIRPLEEKTTLKRADQDAIDRATQMLMNLANEQQDAQTTLALEVLVNRQKPPALQFFLDKMSPGDVAITTIVATYLSLVQPKPREAVDPLIHVYEQLRAPRDLEAMVPVLTALDSIGSPEALPFLERQLRNPYPTIRDKAHQALRRITGTDTFKVSEAQNAYPTRWDFPSVSRDSLYRVIFVTTGGEFTMELYPEKAPVNVANFVFLIKRNFYRGIYFHRVVPGFVIQAGDPRGDGWGGPGYAIPCEYNDIFYERGVVGMAHAGKDTGGSQFFITHTPQPHLNGRHTVIGRVISGMEVVDRLLIFDQILETRLSVSPK